MVELDWCIELLKRLLDCGELELEVLEKIDADILDEAIKSLKEAGATINFPNLYYECAKIALERVGLSTDDAKILCYYVVDYNYMCARIYLSDKSKARKLEEMGFTVVTSPTNPKPEEIERGERKWK